MKKLFRYAISARMPNDEIRLCVYATRNSAAVDTRNAGNERRVREAGKQADEPNILVRAASRRLGEETAAGCSVEAAVHGRPGLASSEKVRSSILLREFMHIRDAILYGEGIAKRG